MEDATSAKAEADSREKRTQEFTQNMRKKSFAKSTEAIKRVINQRKKSKRIKERELAAKKAAAENAAQTSHDLKVVVKTASKVGKGAVKKIKELSKKKNNP